MRIAYITSEIMPYSKTGGLADVSKALTETLSRYADVVCITPLYKNINMEGMEKTDIEFNIFGDNYTIYKDGYIYFIDADIFDRVYGYSDDEIRFAKFSYAASKLLERLGDFDVIHINDWQSSLLAFLLKRSNCKSEIVLTIHNLAYQGAADKSIVDKLNLGWENFTFDKLEFHDSVNFLKSGIVYCDKFNTVSEEYAKEIQTPAFSEGLGGVICENSYKLRGILNGIDYEDFNPRTDRAVIKNYSEETIYSKSENKRILLKFFGLKKESRPLFAFIGRFTKQKGIDIIVNNAEFFSSLDINFIILGSGELNYLVESLNKYENIAVFSGYNESLARMIYASCDFFVMPSIFEPCGLSQMIAASYGSIPIVSSVGGLINTVDEYDESKIFGFRFFVNHYDMFKEKIIKAAKLFKDKDTYVEKAKMNMQKRFSWDESAKRYMDFYNSVFKKTKAADIKDIADEQYSVPLFYDENRVMVMNVNPDLSFVYWNVNPDLLKKYKNLRLIIIDKDLVIFDHEIETSYGEYFLRFNNGMRRLDAKIGLFENEVFVDILEKLEVELQLSKKAEVVENTEFESVYHDR